MFPEYSAEGQDFDIMTVTQQSVNITFITMYDVLQGWEKYRPMLEKNYTVSNFRPHFIRGFLHVGMPLSLDFSNYTEMHQKSEEFAFDYHKQIRDLVAHENQANEYTSLFNTYVTSELMVKKESERIFDADLERIWILAVVYAILKVF